MQRCRFGAFYHDGSITQKERWKVVDHFRLAALTFIVIARPIHRGVIHLEYSTLSAISIGPRCNSSH